LYDDAYNERFFKNGNQSWIKIMVPKSLTIKQFKKMLSHKTNLPQTEFLLFKINFETNKFTPFTSKALQKNLDITLCGILNGYHKSKFPKFLILVIPFDKEIPVLYEKTK